MLRFRNTSDFISGARCSSDNGTAAAHNTPAGANTDSLHLALTVSVLARLVNFLFKFFNYGVDYFLQLVATLKPELKF